MFSLLKIFLNFKKVTQIYTAAGARTECFSKSRTKGWVWLSLLHPSAMCFVFCFDVSMYLRFTTGIAEFDSHVLNASKCYRKVNIWRESTHGFYLWPMQCESFNQISSLYDANINRWSLNAMIFLDINFHAQTTFTFRLSCVNKLTTTK